MIYTLYRQIQLLYQYQYIDPFLLLIKILLLYIYFFGKLRKWRKHKHKIYDYK